MKIQQVAAYRLLIEDKLVSFSQSCGESTNYYNLENCYLNLIALGHEVQIEIEYSDGSREKVNSRVSSDGVSRILF